MNWFQLSYTVLGGLGIFFFGMKLLSESLQAMSSDWIRKIISSLTSNRIIAVLVGLLVTTIIQSSSITTVMIVGFVNAGLMQLSQALGVILGANIGTTITGWIIAIKIGKYAFLLIGLGFLPMLFSKNERLSSIGKIFFALGLVFFGLQTMGDAFKPLRNHQGFLDLLVYFTASNYVSLWATVLIGCALTFVVQSSSAMLGITIALAASGSIGFQTALALVLGENIGTTVTALLASIGTNTNAKRAGVAHALFNILGVIFITSFFWIYKDFIEWIISEPADWTNPQGERPYIAAHIAAGHTIFNVANVILFLPFLKYLEKAVCFLIKEKPFKEVKHLQFLGNSLVMSPSLALEAANQEIKKMAELVNQTFEWTKQYLTSEDELSEIAKKVSKYESITDNIQLEITVYLGETMKAPLTNDESNDIKSILRQADELESLSDYNNSIVKYMARCYRDNVKLDDETKHELLDLYNKAHDFYLYVKNAHETNQPLDFNTYQNKAKEISAWADKMKVSYLERMQLGKYPPLASLTLSDVVVAMRRIKNHTVNLAEAYDGGKQPDSSFNTESI